MDLPLQAVPRTNGAKWFIPSANEWYKAAYHKNNGKTGNYWAYPTKTDSEPNSDQPPGVVAIQSNAGNFNRNDSLANGFNDGYALTATIEYSSTQNYLTDVGAYIASPGPYGRSTRVAT